MCIDGHYSVRHSQGISIGHILLFQSQNWERHGDLLLLLLLLLILIPLLLIRIPFPSACRKFRHATLFTTFFTVNRKRNQKKKGAPIYDRVAFFNGMAWRNWVISIGSSPLRGLPPSRQTIADSVESYTNFNHMFPIVKLNCNSKQANKQLTYEQSRKNTHTRKNTTTTTTMMMMMMMMMIIFCMPLASTRHPTLVSARIHCVPGMGFVLTTRQ